MKIYDINGNELSVNAFSQNMELSYGEYENTAYYLFRVFRKKVDGSKQYPFVYCPDNGSSATMSTLEMQERDKFDFAINGGYFDAFESNTKQPYGITIQNGVVIRETDAYFNNNYHLTVDANGELSYGGTVNEGTTGASLIAQGVKSCLLGLVPLIINYGRSQDTLADITSKFESTEKAQRQVVGQFGNGDYAFLTCEGRDFDDSTGLTLSALQNLCLSINLKFAMAVDGGGSTETCVGTKQMNMIYENEKGRKVPTFIVFNGTDTYGLP